MDIKIKIIIFIGCITCTSFTYAGVNLDNLTSIDMENAARQALVIGNADYQQGQLINPIEDARAISKSLEELGFEVTKLENASHEQMVQAIRTFNELLNNKTIALFYFSGHGARYDGNNYLLPINFSIENLSSFNALNAKDLLNNNAGMNLLFIDASFSSGGRDSYSSFSSISGGKSNTLISYATDADSYVMDSLEKESHSPYTTALLKWMSKPDVPIEAALKKVRNEVKKYSNNRQSPWYESSLDEEFYFKK